ncbi:hypothetical protein BCR44DRAFT_1424165, partial [Catenaria anguillulae PL171]
MIIVGVNAAVTLIEVSVRVAATLATYIGIDTYIKGTIHALAAQVLSQFLTNHRDPTCRSQHLRDIFTYCTIGVTVSDVLRAPAQSAAGATASASGGAGSSAPGTESATIKQSTNA